MSAMEHSCGAVLYRVENGVPYYVLVGQPHLGFPKGHVEAGETEEQTALREIYEETGIMATLDASFSEQVVYDLRKKPGVRKRVTFFLATFPDDQTPKPHNEIMSVRILPYAEARPLLWHADLQRVLDRAHTRILAGLHQA